MLPGQRARIDILNDARKIILERSGESKDQLLTAIGVELGLSHGKAREYYYDAVDYNWEKVTCEETGEEKPVTKTIRLGKFTKEVPINSGPTQEEQDDLRARIDAQQARHLAMMDEKKKAMVARKKTEPLPDESKDVVEAGEEVNEPYEPEKKPYRKAGKSRKVTKEKER